MRTITDIRSKKIRKLEGIIRDMDSVVVAFSGGADSSFLLKAVRDVLGRDVIAVTAGSPTFSDREMVLARRLAGRLRVRHKIIRTDELNDARFRENPPDRCYYCKKELFKHLEIIRVKEGFCYIADGTNCDDLEDYRPGRRAKKEFKVRSPLCEAGLTKRDIRKFSRAVGLPTWDSPAMACIASRIPYGTKIDIRKIGMIKAAEECLRGLGFSQARVRHHGNMASIEVPVRKIKELLRNEIRTKILEKFSRIGYDFILMDIEGYRTGSLNKVLKRRRDV